MMTPTLDPRTARTRKALIDTMTTLIDSRETLEGISITDVTHAAGVSRPTFYQHFGDIHTLVRAAVTARLREVFELVPEGAIGEDWTKHMRGNFVTLLGGMKENAGFFHTVLTISGGYDLHTDVVTLLAERLLTKSPLARRIAAAGEPATAVERGEFLAAGLVWHHIKWLHSDFTGNDSVEAAADRTIFLFLGAIGASEDEIRAVLHTTARR